MVGESLSLVNLAHVAKLSRIVSHHHGDGSCHCPQSRFLAATAHPQPSDWCRCSRSRSRRCSAPPSTRSCPARRQCVAVDYHVTQVVDVTKGIHGMIPKAIFKTP